MNKEHIDSVYSTFEQLVASLKVTRRAINKFKQNQANQVEFSSLFQRTKFFGNLSRTKGNNLDLAQDDLSDLIIVGLMAHFERELRSDLMEKIDLSITEQDSVSQRLSKETQQSIERWKFEDILDIYKGKVDEDLIGNLKKPYRYRNWIAHGKKPSDIPEQCDPKTTYTMILSFYDELGKAARLSKS